MKAAFGGVSGETFVVIHWVPSPGSGLIAAHPAGSAGLVMPSKFCVDVPHGIGVGVGVGEPPPPTIVAPRKARTSAMGLAIELVAPAPPQLPSPAKTRPTARGLLSVSSTTKEPESPQSSKLPPLSAITICPVKVS